MVQQNRKKTKHAILAVVGLSLVGLVGLVGFSFFFFFLFVHWASGDAAKTLGPLRSLASRVVTEWFYGRTVFFWSSKPVLDIR